MILFLTNRTKPKRTASFEANKKWQDNPQGQRGTLILPYEALASHFIFRPGPQLFCKFWIVCLFAGFALLRDGYEIFSRVLCLEVGTRCGVQRGERALLGLYVDAEKAQDRNGYAPRRFRV